MSQLFCCTKLCIPDKKEEEIELKNLPIIVKKIESPNRRNSRLNNNFDTEPQQIRIEDDLKFFIYSQRQNTIPKVDKVLSSSKHNDIMILERNAITSQSDKERISQKHLDKIKEICEEMKVKLSKKGSSEKKISEKISLKKSTSLTPIKSVYNGSQSSNACSQTVANTPAVNNAISIELSANKMKIEKLNEALKQTVIRKSPKSNANFNISTNKKNLIGYKQDNLSQAYDKISRRKIEVEYDLDVVYGKPSNFSDNRARTIEGEKSSKSHNLYEYEGDLQEVKKKIVEEENVVDKDVIDEGEGEFVNDERVGRIKMNINAAGIKVNENINSHRIENMTLKVKSNSENQSKIIKEKNNPNIDNKNKDQIKSAKDNQVNYNNDLDKNNASKTLHNQSPKKNKYTGYINEEFSNENNEQPSNLLIPKQIQPNKQLNNSSHFDINPYNKNFEILLGQPHSNHNNRKENYHQQNENYTARPNNTGYYQIDRNEASPYNMMNYRNSFDLNHSYQFNPNHSQTLNYNPNNNFYNTNPQNYYPFGNAPNTVNYLSDNSQISNFSYNTSNGVNGFNQINPISQIAPYSCPNCENIYKNSIFNNVPLNLMKCMCCQNVINSVSLDFYLKKYREDLFEHRKNLLKENENPRESQGEGGNNSYHAINKAELNANKANVKAELKANKPTEHVVHLKNKNSNRTMNELEYEDCQDIKINSSSKRESLSTNKETFRHDREKLANKKKLNEVNADDIQEINKVDDNWADWIEEKKKEVKKNIAFTVPFTTGIKEKNSGAGKIDIKDKIDNGKDNVNIVNDVTTLSDMFKNKKKEFMNKIEKRKQKENKEEKENIPKAIVLISQEISRNDISPKKDSKSNRDSKKVESINFTEKKQEKNPKNKNSKEKLTKNIKKKEEFTKRKEKQLEFAYKLKQDLNKKHEES